MAIDALPIQYEEYRNFNLSTPISANEYFDTKILGRNNFYDPINIDIKNDLRKKLYSYLVLNNNWDNYGAIKPEEKVIRNCFGFLRNLPERYLSNLSKEDLSITPYGTIVLDWEDKNKLLSIEIGNDSLGYFTELNDTENLSSEAIKYDQDEIPSEVVKAFHTFNN